MTTQMHEVSAPALTLAGFLDHWLGHRRLTRRVIAAFPEDGLGQFLRLSLLLALMTIATFIDFDEQTIPDAVTVPGTIAALALSAALPFSALDLVVETELQPLLLSSPLEWPAWLSAPEGLAIGIACLVLWCAALTPRTWTLRRGWRRGLQFAWASMFRNSLWWKYAILAVSLLLGLLYAVPNLYGEAPAVQVSSGKATLKIDAGAASLEGLQVIWRDQMKGRGGQFGAAVAFSPDGRHLVFTTIDVGGGLRVVRIADASDGGLELELTAVIENADAPIRPKGVRFSADGRHLLIAYGDNVSPIPRRGGHGFVAVHEWDPASGTIGRRIDRSSARSGIECGEDLTLIADDTAVIVTDQFKDAVHIMRLDRFAMEGVPRIGGELYRGVATPDRAGVIDQPETDGR